MGKKEDLEEFFLKYPLGIKEPIFSWGGGGYKYYQILQISRKSVKSCDR